MSDVVVRTCGSEDAAFAANALATVIAGSAHEPRLAKVLADPDVILCVATVAGAPAGIAYGYVYPRLNDDRRATLLYEVDAALPFRRRGVGTALMEAFAEACDERGAPVHWLITDHGNEAALALYRKAGGVLSPTDDAMFTFGKAVCTSGGQAAATEAGS